MRLCATELPAASDHQVHSSSSRQAVKATSVSWPASHPRSLSTDERAATLPHVRRCGKRLRAHQETLAATSRRKAGNGEVNSDTFTTRASRSKAKRSNGAAEVSKRSAKSVVSHSFRRARWLSPSRAERSSSRHGTSTSRNNYLHRVLGTLLKKCCAQDCMPRHERFDSTLHTSHIEQTFKLNADLHGVDVRRTLIVEGVKKQAFLKR